LKSEPLGGFSGDAMTIASFDTPPLIHSGAPSIPNSF